MMKRENLQSDVQESDEKESDEEGLTEYDKTLADSFPSSDPPAQP